MHYGLGQQQSYYPEYTGFRPTYPGYHGNLPIKELKEKKIEGATAHYYIAAIVNIAKALFIKEAKGTYKKVEEVCFDIKDYLGKNNAQLLSKVGGEILLKRQKGNGGNFNGFFEQVAKEIKNKYEPLQKLFNNIKQMKAEEEVNNGTLIKFSYSLSTSSPNYDAIDLYKLGNFIRNHKYNAGIISEKDLITLDF